MVNRNPEKTRLLGPESALLGNFLPKSGLEQRPFRPMVAPWAIDQYVGKGA
jgi:hypothetical protein